MHMQLIKFGQNFQALTILWTDDEFYVLHEVSLKIATHKDWLLGGDFILKGELSLLCTAFLSVLR